MLNNTALKSLFLSLSLPAAIMTSGTVQASFDESLAGDLSGDFLNPTAINFNLGSNIISGSVGGSANGGGGATNGSDADYFSFSLAANQTLNAIRVISIDPADSNRSFFGYINDTNFQNQSTVDGFVLFQDNSGDVTSGLIGGPLTGGIHSFWIQETAGVLRPYSIEFEVTQVPVPAAALLFGSALGFLPWLKRRQKKQS